MVSRSDEYGSLSAQYLNKRSYLMHLTKGLKSDTKEEL